MLKKTIKFTDYDGNEREEDWYFNMNKAELFELESSVNGGFNGILSKIVQDQNGAEIMRIFKELILKCVGKKSNDGRRFEKSEEISNEFLQTEAYSELFMELVTDADKAAKFIEQVMPSEKEIDQVVAKANKTGDKPAAMPAA